MPVPKKKMSKARSRKRRGASYKAKAPALTTCPRCGSPMLPHRACPTCGYYKGRKVL